MSAATPTLAAALALLAGCVTVEYEHHRALEAIAGPRVEALSPGESDLGACLDALGAPLYVWEYNGDGLALGYAWEGTRHWTAGVRLEATNGTSASFNYTDIDAATRGYVLFFDRGWRLTAIRKGYLRDIGLALAPQRPASLED